MKESCSEWSTESWRNFEISQQPEYLNLNHVEEIQNKVISFITPA
jgi:hypothetical protein